MITDDLTKVNSYDLDRKARSDPSPRHSFRRPCLYQKEPITVN